jgi:hypothetical protein
VKFDGEIGVMNKKLCAVIAAATLSLASQATAGTINFSSYSGPLTATDIPGITYTATASSGSIFPTGTSPTDLQVAAFGRGLGVIGSGDALSPSGEANAQGKGRRIDGDGLVTGSWEMLTITFFGGAVNLTNFVLSFMDPDDDFEYCFGACNTINSVFTTVAAGVALTNDAGDGKLDSQEDRTYVVNATNVTSFSIRATNSGGDDGDDFALFKANVSAVPLPAGAPLLLAGLAGLALLRRRKKAA